MLDLEENKRSLLEMQNRLTQLSEALRITDLEENLKTLEAQTLQENFWEDSQNSSTVFSQMNVLQKKLKTYQNLKTEWENLMELNELLFLEKDDALAKDLISNTQKIQTELANIEVQTLLSGKYDNNNALVTIHPEIGRAHV